VVDRLVANLSKVAIPESMLSRYLPAQYLRLRMGEVGGNPVTLIVDTQGSGKSLTMVMLAKAIALE
jgi:tagatose-1,6-bisphosphate aldolase non-catalytic subunit AgaZ/GatZ